MMKYQKYKWLFACVLTAALLSAHAQTRQLRKGDRLYDQQNYSAAEIAYRDAVAGPLASFNAGNAAFQQGKYAEAATLYQNAERTAADASFKSNALYNMGNALLRSEKYAEAIEAYKSSLRQRPNQPDAKKNLQIAIKKLREQEDPPPPPIPPPPPPPPPKQRPRNNYLDQANAGRKPEVTSGGMSPEAARNLLETRVTKQEQENAQQYRQLAPAVRPSRVKKDW